MARYVNIVFVTGDEAAELIDRLYNRESPDSVMYHGAWQESAHAAAVELAEWDNGESDDIRDQPSAGSGDDTWNVRVHGVPYVLSANLGLGYAGLERVIFS